MADFSPLYTGKNTATILPSGEGTQRALGELTDMVKAAEEIKYKTFKENEKWFLENANIDPIFVISDAARKSQMELIQRFNKKWAKRAQETNYNLNNQDKMQMMTDKDVVTSLAQGQLAQMEMWKQHKNLVQQNPTKFDLTKFEEATQEYMRTGNYTQTMPAFQPIDFGNYVQEQAVKLGFNADKAPVVAGGQRGFESWNIPKQDIGRFIVSQVGENPQADVDFWNRWGKADKQYWISRGEQEKKNPIMLWAENEFPNVRQSQYQYMKNIPKAGGAGEEYAVKKIRPGMVIPDQPKRFGDREYSKDSFSFESTTVISGIPTRHGAVLNATWTEDEIANGVINGRIVLYDPWKRIFLVESVVTSESADQKSRTLLEIPEENIMKYEDIRVDYRGNIMSIGEFKKETYRTGKVNRGFGSKEIPTTTPPATTAPTKPNPLKPR